VLKKKRSNKMNETKYNFKSQARDLLAGDKIKIHFSIGPFSDAVVKQVAEKTVTFYRPYGTTCGFLTTAGTICYTGLEEFEVPRDATEYFVYERPVLR
jgi:hypothetical protein